jgi:hypothetical protein
MYILLNIARLNSRNLDYFIINILILVNKRFLLSRFDNKLQFKALPGFLNLLIIKLNKILP